MADTESVLEIGCGPGQLACLLRDKGIRKYQGFDFSPKRIAQTKQACPNFSFSVQDAFKTDLFTSWDYDAVICTEFLEHVDRDVEVLKRIKPGAKFYGTVPNFPFTSHVRFFGRESEVVARYGSYFSDLRVDAFFLTVEAKPSISWKERSAETDNRSKQHRFGRASVIGICTAQIHYSASSCRVTRGRT